MQTEKGISQQELLSQVISERGYIVLATSASYKVGDKVAPFNGPTERELIDHPFVVTKKTNLEDFCTQLGIYERVGYPCSDPALHALFYYRIVTD